MSIERRCRPNLIALAATVLTGLWLAGCTPAIQGFEDATETPRLAKDTAIVSDGARLPLRVWRARHTRAVIVAVHGFNDYSNTFSMISPWLNKRGITVYAYDQRGFGKTAQPGVWAGSEVMVSDLRKVASLAKRRHPRAPLYVLGVSMGGAVTMTALDGPGIPEAEGAMLVAPAVWGWQAMNPFYKSALWLAAHTVPSMTATGAGLGVQPSDNIPMLRKLGADPLVIKKTRIDSVYGLVTLMDQANDAASRIEIPVLYLYGRKDEIVPKAPTVDVAQRITAPKRFVYYKNGWHMLLRDKQRKQVWGDIAAWISKRKGRLPSGDEVRALDTLK